MSEPRDGSVKRWLWAAAGMLSRIAPIAAIVAAVHFALKYW
jgi:hypothetical protein